MGNQFRSLSLEFVFVLLNPFVSPESRSRCKGFVLNIEVMYEITYQDLTGECLNSSWIGYGILNSMTRE